MSGWRGVALSLTIVLAIFIVAMSASLVTTWAHERHAGMLTHPAIPALKEELGKAPKDEALIGQLRRVDLLLIEDHLASRRRFTLAGWALLVATIGLVASAKWFVALSPARPPEELLAARPPHRRQRSVVAALATVAAGALLLILWAVFKVPRLPGDQPPGTAGPTAATTGTAVASAALPEAPVAPAPSWPGFRGPGNLGLAGPGDWPTTFSTVTGENILWSVEAPFDGRSSPAVWGDRVFLTGADAAEQRVACFEISSGTLLWNSVVVPASAPPQFEAWEDTGFAAPTPVVDGRRVYAMFGAGLLAAFDFDGKQVWVHEFGRPDSVYGFASSPLLYGDTVILQYDQSSDGEAGLSFLYGFDAATGQVRWKTGRPVPNSWSSPALIRAGERDEVIACGDPWVIGYDPKTGAELWRAEGLEGDIAASPAFGGGHVFVTNDGAQLMAIRPGGAGDVTQTHVAWTFPDGLPDTSSPVSDGKRVLQVASGGHLTCIDAASGKLVWEHFLEGSATASPILAGDRVYLSCEDGFIRVFDLGDQYRDLDHGDAGEPLYATPAFVESRLYIRTKGALLCVGRRP